MVRDMFKGLSATARLLIIVMALSISAITFVYWQVGTGAAALISLVICVILISTKSIWVSSGNTRVRLASLALLLAAGSYGVWAPFFDALMKGLQQSPEWIARFPWLAKVTFDSEPSLAVLIVDLLGVFIVNYFMAKDGTLTGIHPDPVEDEFPELKYQEKLDRFAGYLTDRLRTLDRESNWSPDYYTQLEADVEIRSRTNAIASRRVTNLLTALRSDNKSQAFLVLGDPGAGKSVALRKLSVEMLKEVSKTGRVPIYVNLREWMPPDEEGKRLWNEHNKPSVADLYEFVVTNILATADVFSVDFVNKYFKKMWEHGRLFFILDSFDEIPQLLDEGEDSWLIEHLSMLIWTLIAGNRASRGVLASRFFRRPTDVFQASKILEIRPLSEEKIVHALDRFPRFDQNLQKQLFHERNDLVPIVRNPFLMALLGTWVQEHGSFPQHQGDIYDSYLRGRLATCKKRLDQKGVSVDELLEAATAIAWFLFDSKEYGLEAPVNAIIEKAEIPKAELAIDLLAYARIGRTGSGDIHTFAFVHRRFLEYFSVQRLITFPQLAPIEDIPTDSRGRDALVLYAQVANQQEAERLARYCWDQLLAGFEQNAEYWLRAVHSLRFLSDAFRARRECIQPFQDELAAFIMACVRGERDLLLAKLSLEATGLLPENRMEPVLQEAIEGGNDWLQETAFKACRQIPRLSAEMEDALVRYIWNVPMDLFWSTRQNLMFSLLLSPGLSSLRTTAQYRIWDIQLLAFGFMIFFLFYPLFGGAIAFFYMVYSIFVGWHFHADFRLFMLPIELIVLSTVFEPNSALYASLNIYTFINSPFAILLTVLMQVPIMQFVDVFPRWIAKLKTDAISEFFSETFEALKEYTSYLAIVLIGSSILLSMFFLFLYELFQYTSPYKWIQVVLGYLGYLGYSLGGAITVFFVFTLIFHCYHLYLDTKIKKQLKISDRLTRSQIVAFLNGFKTAQYRLRFVEMLAERKVIAIEQWPTDFSLNARNDQAITQLAKLEEKWLGLDR
ncbi:MAG: NACHT domain-containing protein [Methylobacter sp.]|nr:NACHT domain-containing protein [Methylobacter sp.]